MIQIRKGEERGHFNHGWLDTYHTFSFSDYFDPQYMGFRSLRVINEDVVAPGAGFPTHSHRDMEIITYILDGSLEHKDSMGNGSVIGRGMAQRMTAGSGVTHSEYNASKTKPVHLLQIWILPEEKNLKPGYEEKVLNPHGKPGEWRLLASRNGEDAVRVHQDVQLFTGFLSGEEELVYNLSSSRYAWIQLASGEATVNGQLLKAGDGASVQSETRLHFASKNTAEILLFNLN